MNPRKVESKAKLFTEIPGDLRDLMAETLKETYQSSLKDYTVTISGRIYPEEILVQIALNQPGSIRQHNFLASVDHDFEKQNSLAQMHIALDALDGFLAAFLGEEETDMPLDWHEYDFDDQKVNLMYDTTNTSLEAQANALLGLKDGEELIDEDELGSEFFAATPQDIESSDDEGTQLH